MYVYLGYFQSILHPIGNLFFLAIDVVEESLEEFGQGLTLNSFPESFHEGEKEVDVMHRQQVAKVVVLLNHVQISSSEMGASLTAAALFYRSKVLSICLVSQFDLSERGKGRAKTSCPGRKNTVEHVHSDSHAQSQIYWIPDSHQIPGFVGWQSFAALSDRPEEIFLGLTS